MNGRYPDLVSRVRRLGSVAVAFSGGADSALVAAAAREALEERAAAVTAVSATLPREERAAAAELARTIGIRHLELEIDELASPRFVVNAPDRCYHCKLLRMSAIGRLAEAQGLAAVADGTNADDEGDWRPGLRANRELGVRSPLLEAGIGKEEVRALLRELGLDVHAKCSSPCLASRVPYGSPVTAGKLRQVEEAEALLHGLGFREVRVRHHGDVARLEVPRSDFARLLAQQGLAERLRSIGFLWVALDLEGFHSGGLNRALPRTGERDA